jgi:hypothetical protein
VSRIPGSVRYWKGLRNLRPANWEWLGTCNISRWPSNRNNIERADFAFQVARACFSRSDALTGEGGGEGIRSRGVCPPPFLPETVWIRGRWARVARKGGGGGRQCTSEVQLSASNCDGSMWFEVPLLHDVQSHWHRGTVFLSSTLKLSLLRFKALHHDRNCSSAQEGGSEGAEEGGRSWCSL